MRDYERETENRVKFIQELPCSSGAGIVYGIVEVKTVLMGILCKMACVDTWA